MYGKTSSLYGTVQRQDCCHQRPLARKRPRGLSLEMWACVQTKPLAWEKREQCLVGPTKPFASPDRPCRRGWMPVRQDVVLFLEDHGCVVLEAATTEQASAICKAGAPIDVLFTDVPLNGGSSGWEIAETFRAAPPDIAVVYASGNSSDHSRCLPVASFSTSHTARPTS